MEESQKIRAVEALRKAIRIAGSQSALARTCGCTPGNISQLVIKGSVLPAQYVLKVESTYGVSRHELRPDLYPDPAAPSEAGGLLLPAGRTLAGGAPVTSCNRSDFLQAERVP